MDGKRISRLLRRLGLIRVDPLVDGLRKDTRYGTLLRRMNLPH